MPALRKVLHLGDHASIKVGRVYILVDHDVVDFLRDYSLAFQRNKTTAFIQAASRDRSLNIRLARLIMRPLPGQVVDHINGDPLDNRRDNLRVVSSQANSQNRAKVSMACTSRYKGVSRLGGRWRAVIYLNGRQINLGTHQNEKGAAIAYDDAARGLFGQCAALNFPRAGEQSAHRPRTISFHPSTNSQKAHPNNG